ncbi:hypothetical protein [Catenulispora pinisilvae]|uniref:hypothetical protein n=1 Tax=Catenulispora pinisilvae TaxID=2705253 RepID=UPI0018919B38|nr:hypothetical protein [Catenulispora pinisilvae]
MTRTTLEKIADRQQALSAQADQVRAQIQQLADRLRDLDAELSDLHVARKVILELGPDEPAPPGLPDHPDYQHILTVLTGTKTPQRAKDLCHALDMELTPNRIEGVRAKVKRLVKNGLVVENEPGLFTLAHPPTAEPAADQQP